MERASSAGTPVGGSRRIELGPRRTAANQVSPWTTLPSGPLLIYLTLVLPDEAVMSAKPKLTTVVSTKGQVILPKAIRERLRWPAGTELTVEDTIEGVLLKAKPAFAPTRPKDVFGSLPCKGPAKSASALAHRAAENP